MTEQGTDQERRGDARANNNSNEREGREKSQSTVRTDAHEAMDIQQGVGDMSMTQDQTEASDAPSADNSACI